ncbi:MAG TPA: DUF1015 domain-containing protein [Erysipelotrichaceae bacterium]|nr:DUF1015 domain-containing protein [Erysipelotrichaceae bacterium]HQB31965.1 DUF1015 domain-containing protein [Erysipelotrichaceae bacterium]
MKIPFKAGNILLPKKNIDLTKWSTVACDQYTSEQEYWEELDKVVADSPSTLRITLPEIYLVDKAEDRIKNINETMKKYLHDDLFDEYTDAIFYIRRKQKDGRVRDGIIGLVDLEAYDYTSESDSLIRATEKTIIERIPPRVKIREKAFLELPHIMILIDDSKKEIIEGLKEKVSKEEQVYDFELNMNGGHLEGYNLNNLLKEEVLNGLNKLMDKKAFAKKYGVKEKKVLLFAVGDGNHSLSTAKTIYENIKKTNRDYLNSSSRYALAELVNLHSEALEFEAIHRIVFDTDTDKMLKELYEYYNVNEDGKGQKVEVTLNGEVRSLYIENPRSNLSVGSIQIFLDNYLKNNKGRIDYIHGYDTVRELSKKENSIGFIFDAIGKDEFFKTIILDGVLPIKTFSIGHAHDKRYYTEARKIK